MVEQELAIRKWKAAGGVIAVAIAFVAFVRHFDFYPFFYLLQVGGSMALASLSRSERWQERVGIVIAAHLPMFLYLFLFMKR